MPLINKANAVSQMQTILSGVTVATEDTTRLLALLETAKNAGLYSANVENQLLTRISSVSTSNTVTEVALRAKAADLVHFDKQLSTANLTTLNAFSANVGTIVYVDSAGVPYIRKNNNTWSIIDAVLSSQLKNAWSWGSNNLGQLGDGTTTGSGSPVSIIGGFTDWKELSAGGNHGLGLRANGTAWAWGYGNAGRLGDGTTSNRSSPVSVVGGFTDWITLAGGGFHSLGIRANGILYSWGSNYTGQLGDGTSTARSSPVSVVGGFTDWISISAAVVHTLALRANGTLWSWGRNQFGQSGDGTSSVRSSPVSVVGGFTDWIFAAAGGYHSLGIRTNGILYGWGENLNGTLGDGTATNRNSPVSVVGGFTDWISASGGRYHSHAIRANGTLWGWGLNSSGQVGHNVTVFAVSSPVSVVGGFTDWVSVTGIFRTAAALRANGTLWRWGGDTGTSSPVSVVGGYTDWISVSGNGAAGVVTLGLRGG